MTDTAPLVITLVANAAPVAAGSDLTTVIGEAPWAATVTSVEFIATSTLTGANTDTRTCSVINKALDGTGTTSVASKGFVSGTNATGGDSTAITLSGTAGHLVLAAGDVLDWTSAHSGSTGLADPGGKVIVTISRS